MPGATSLDENEFALELKDAKNQYSDRRGSALSGRQSAREVDGMRMDAVLAIAGKRAMAGARAAAFTQSVR
jgi:hypothetical protein